MRSSSPIVQVRLASWREVVKATPCRACGAAAGIACEVPGCAGCHACTRQSGCSAGTQLHHARLDAWLRVGGPAAS